MWAISLKYFRDGGSSGYYGSLCEPKVDSFWPILILMTKKQGILYHFLMVGFLVKEWFL